MSTKLRMLSLMAIIGASLAGATYAATTVDAHRIARERIAPSFPNHPPSTTGAQGRLIEPQEYVDPQILAGRLLHDNRWPAAVARSEVGGASADTGHFDPQRRARSMILGNDH